MIDETLFASVEPPLLAGSRCADCGTVVFPDAPSCPRCSGSALERVPLPATGTLWSWTVQAFAPKPPYVTPESGFTPYAVGYVHLGDVIVEGRLVGSEWQIGQQVQLVLLPVFGDTVTYAFEAVS